jgi:hypothetical protein
MTYRANWPNSRRRGSTSASTRNAARQKKRGGGRRYHGAVRHALRPRGEAPMRHRERPRPSRSPDSASDGSDLADSLLRTRRRSHARAAAIPIVSQVANRARARRDSCGSLPRENFTSPIRDLRNPRRSQCEHHDFIRPSLRFETRQCHSPSVECKDDARHLFGLAEFDPSLVNIVRASVEGRCGVSERRQNSAACVDRKRDRIGVWRRASLSACARST